MICFGRFRKGKSLQEIFGEEKAKVIKNKKSEKLKIAWRVTNKYKNRNLTVWNKGLTKNTDERVKKIGEKLSTSQKNRTYEQKYGTERAKLIKEKISKTETNRIFSESHKKKLKDLALRRLLNNEFNCKSTLIEIKIENFLNSLGLKKDSEYKMHYWINIIEHKYAADFLIIKQNLIIECDGDYWHGNPIKFKTLSEYQKNRQERDKIRTEELRNANYKILRFWEHEINNNFDSVKNKILQELGVFNDSQ